MTDLVADYIVVGGGLTGCVIASRLKQSAGKNLEVVLLEAGPETDNPAAARFLSGLSLLGSDLDYAHQSQPVPSTNGRSHTLNAGRCLGGGSLLNFGGWLRADGADYDEWAETVADARWSHEGFKPWLRRAEEAMQVVSIGQAECQYRLRGPVRQAWIELGVPLINLESKDGGGAGVGGLAEMRENSRDGLRQPSHTVYPLDGVKVLTNTVADRIIFSGNKATGVEYGGRKITARKEVIICAGAYHTPQLL